MLVLSRKKGEQIEIEVGDVLVKVSTVRIGRQVVKIGIDAPEFVNVRRWELNHVEGGDRSIPGHDGQ